MTKKLPFRVEPKPYQKIVVGDTEIGELEIPKLNDLTPNERIKLAEWMREYPDQTTIAVTLGRAIADNSELSALDAANALLRGDNELLKDFPEQIIQYQKSFLDYADKRRVGLATLILKRILSEWTMEDTLNDTEIPPKLITELAKFGTLEERGGKEPEPIEEEKEPELKDKDIEGKPEPVPA